MGLMPADETGPLPGGLLDRLGDRPAPVATDLDGSPWASQHQASQLRASQHRADLRIGGADAARAGRGTENRTQPVFERCHDYSDTPGPFWHRAGAQSQITRPYHRKDDAPFPSRHSRRQDRARGRRFSFNAIAAYPTRSN